jgi:hypothetical protein
VIMFLAGFCRLYGQQPGLLFHSLGNFPRANEEWTFQSRLFILEHCARPSPISLVLICRRFSGLLKSTASTLRIRLSQPTSRLVLQNSLGCPCGRCYLGCSHSGRKCISSLSLEEQRAGTRNDNRTCHGNLPSLIFRSCGLVICCFLVKDFCFVWRTAWPHLSQRPNLII